MISSPQELKCAWNLVRLQRLSWKCMLLCMMERLRTGVPDSLCRRSLKVADWLGNGRARFFVLGVVAFVSCLLLPHLSLSLAPSAHDRRSRRPRSFSFTQLYFDCVYDLAKFLRRFKTATLLNTSIHGQKEYQINLSVSFSLRV